MVGFWVEGVGWVGGEKRDGWGCGGRWKRKGSGGVGTE